MSASRTLGQESPEDQYIVVYDLIQDAESFHQANSLALPKYREAQAKLKAIQKEFPDWNTQVVTFRLDYLASKIVLSATQAAQVDSQKPSPSLKPTISSVAATQPKTVQRKIIPLEKLNEQIHLVKLNIAQFQQEAQATITQSSEAMSERLNLIEQSIIAHRDRKLEATQSFSRFVLMITSTFAIAGILAVVLGAYFRWCEAGLLAEIFVAMSMTQLRRQRQTAAALYPDKTSRMSANQISESSSKMLRAVERLEKRILNLEHPI